jgi:hypothetical protein
MISFNRASQLLEPFGQLKPQSAGDWNGSFELPPEVNAFYCEVGPVNLDIPGYGNNYFMPCLANLWQYQAGYRSEGTNGCRIRGWDDDWLVVADCGADPFIFSRSSGAILFATHGAGRWEPTPIFANIFEMGASLAIVGSVVTATGRSLTDEKGYILPSCRAVALTGLAEVAGSIGAAENVVGQLGWG